MKGKHLGELEELVLLAIYRLGDEAYGVTVQNLLEKEAQRKATLGALYSALERLERKGFLGSKLGGASGDRGGRRKRYFSITPSGVRAIERVREIREALWRSARTAPASKG